MAAMQREIPEAEKGASARRQGLCSSTHVCVMYTLATWRRKRLQESPLLTNGAKPARPVECWCR